MDTSSNVFSQAEFSARIYISVPYLDSFPEDKLFQIVFKRVVLVFVIHTSVMLKTELVL